MKKISISLIVLILICATLPYGMGILSLNTLQSYTDKINQSDYIPIEATIKNVKRGWFKTQLELDFKYVADKVPHFVKEIIKKDKQYKNVDIYEHDQKSITTTININHGPIAYKPDTTDNGIYFGRGAGDVFFDYSTLLKGEILKTWKAFKKANPQLEHYTLFHLYFGYLGGMSNEYVKGPSKSKYDGHNFDFKGLKLNVDFNQGALTGGHFIFKGMAIETPKGDMKIGQFNYHVAYHSDEENFSLRFDTLLDSLKILEKGGSNFDISIEQVEALSLLEAQEYVSFKEEYDVAKVKIKSKEFNQEFGPGHYSIEVKNINKEAASSVFESYKSIIQHFGDDKRMGLASIGLLAQLPHLLKDGPEILLDIHVHTPKGQIIAKGYALINKKGNRPINLQDIPAQAQCEINFQVPIDYAKYLLVSQESDKIKKNIKADEPLTPEQIEAKAKANADQRINEMITQGFVMEKGKFFISKLSYKHNQFFINDKQFPM